MNIFDILYKKRWLCAAGMILILVVLGYGYDLYPLQNQIAELQKVDINIHEKLLFPAEKHAENPDQKKMSDMHAFVGVIHASGLTIQAINRLGNSNEMHVDLQGNYQQWMNFIYILQQKSQLINVHNFTCKWSEKNNLEISLDVLLLGNLHAMPYQYIGLNPFCTLENLDHWIDQKAKNVLLTPLAQIKMVGYLQLGRRNQAMMLFPDKIIKTVEAGNVLGLERAQVVKVFPHYVLVRLQDGRNVKV